MPWFGAPSGPVEVENDDHDQSAKAAATRE
jgi:hypothetical protein